MGTRAKTGRCTVISVGMAALALGVALASALPAAAAKKPTACTILRPSAIAKIVGAPVGPGDAGTGAYGCSFDVGAGFGEPGGGLVVMQLYTGSLASGIFSAAKSGQKVGNVYWDPQTAIATGKKGGTTVAASYSLTGTDDAEHRDQAIALVEAARKRL